MTPLEEDKHIMSAPNGHMITNDTDMNRLARSLKKTLRKSTFNAIKATIIYLEKM